MFGLGMGEIILIVVVALLFVGPEKLPGAAKSIGKGIRDLRKQTRDLQDTIENDSHIGDAVRELKSALRGDPERPAPKPKPKAPAANPEALAAKTGDPALPAAGSVPAVAEAATAGDGASTADLGAAPHEAADGDEAAGGDEPAAVDPDIPVLRTPEGSVARGGGDDSDPDEDAARG